MRFAPARDAVVARGVSAFVTLGALVPPVPRVMIGRQVGHWWVVAVVPTLAGLVAPGVCIPAGPVTLRGWSLRVALDVVVSLGCFVGVLAAFV